MGIAISREPRTSSGTELPSGVFIAAAEEAKKKNPDLQIPPPVAPEPPPVLSPQEKMARDKARQDEIEALVRDLERENVRILAQERQDAAEKRQTKQQINAGIVAADTQADEAVIATQSVQASANQNAATRAAAVQPYGDSLADLPGEIAQEIVALRDQGQAADQEHKRNLEYLAGLIQEQKDRERREKIAARVRAEVEDREARGEVLSHDEVIEISRNVQSALDNEQNQQEQANRLNSAAKLWKKRPGEDWSGQRTFSPALEKPDDVGSTRQGSTALETGAVPSSLPDWVSPEERRDRLTQEAERLQIEADQFEQQTGRKPNPRELYLMRVRINEDLDHELSKRSPGVRVAEGQEQQAEAARELKEVEAETNQEMRGLQAFLLSGLISDPENFDRFAYHFMTGDRFTGNDEDGLEMINGVLNSPVNRLNAYGIHTGMTRGETQAIALRVLNGDLEIGRVDERANLTMLYRRANPGEGVDRIEERVNRHYYNRLQEELRILRSLTGSENPGAAVATATVGVNEQRLQFQELTDEQREKLTAAQQALIGRRQRSQNGRKKPIVVKLADKLTKADEKDETAREAYVEEQVTRDSANRKRTEDDKRKALQDKFYEQHPEERRKNDADRLTERLEKMFTDFILNGGVEGADGTVVGSENIRQMVQEAVLTGDRTDLESLGVNLGELQQALERHAGALNRENRLLLRTLRNLQNSGRGFRGDDIIGTMPGMSAVETANNHAKTVAREALKDAQKRYREALSEDDPNRIADYVAAYRAIYPTTTLSDVQIMATYTDKIASDKLASDAAKERTKGKLLKEASKGPIRRAISKRTF